MPGLYPAAELSFSICGDKLFRLLAAMAYYALFLAARLSLYTAGRQSPRPFPDLYQPDDNNVAGRPLAWSKLDLCSMGRLARALSVDREVPAGTQGKGFGHAH